MLVSTAIVPLLLKALIDCSVVGSATMTDAALAAVDFLNREDRRFLFR